MCQAYSSDENTGRSILGAGALGVGYQGGFGNFGDGSLGGSGTRGALEILVTGALGGRVPGGLWGHCGWVPGVIA